MKNPELLSKNFHTITDEQCQKPKAKLEQWVFFRNFQWCIWKFHITHPKGFKGGLKDFLILRFSGQNWRLFEKKLINEKEVEKYWREMILKNRKLPTQTFNQYYEKLFKKDFKAFNCDKYYEDL